MTTPLLTKEFYVDEFGCGCRLAVDLDSFDGELSICRVHAP